MTHLNSSPWPRRLAAAVLMAALLLLLETGATRLVPAVPAAVETEPVPHPGDAADDMCVWLHPDDPGRSVIIGTDKDGGLAVYDLDGRQLEFRADGRLNNVDVRDHLPLATGSGAIIAASNRNNRSINGYTIDPGTRRLQPLGQVPVAFEPYGLCLYYSRQRHAVDAIVTAEDGRVEQWQLGFADGTLTGTRLRQLQLGGKCEGCVADDERGVFYISEERVGVWRFGAEPDSGPDPQRQVCTVGWRKPVQADAEGLAIYGAADGKGYLLVSSQGSSRFAVFRRDGDNAFVGCFRIATGTIDPVSGTDGIEVVNRGLQPAFPHGLFIAQDDRNDVGHQNFKLVRWDAIAGVFQPPLTIDVDWDLRKVGQESTRQANDE